MLGCTLDDYFSHKCIYIRKNAQPTLKHEAFSVSSEDGMAIVGCLTS